MLPVFCPTNHQTSHSRVCSNTIRYLFKRSFIYGDKILYFYPTQDLFPDQLFLCHVDIYSDDRVSKHHHHLRYLCVSDRECNPGCSGSPRHLGSTSSLQNFRLRCLQPGNHSLRREALLTGRSGTEPSERGRDLLTLHKLSDVLLSCPLVSVSSWTYSQTLYYKFTLKRVEERHRNNICLQDSFFVLFLLLVCSFCSPVHTCFIYLMLKKHIDKKYVCL